MIVCCGEALVDLVRDPATSEPIPVPGGAPANTAVTTARLGIPTAFCGRISTDAYGETMIEHLRASGVRLELLERGIEPTAVARVEHEPTPVFHFEGDGTADTVLGPIDLDVLDVPRGEPLLLHSGSLAMFRGSAATSILALFERHDSVALRSLDPNVRPFAITEKNAWHEMFQQWLSATELVRSSEDDLRWIAPAQDPLTTAGKLLEHGPAVAVVTRGSEGSVAVTPTGSVEVGAAPVTVADTVGAGDSFTGGILTWLHRRGVADRAELLTLSTRDWRAALDFATTVAGITCARVGADPPWRHELEAT